jgi:chitinase
MDTKKTCFPRKIGSMSGKVSLFTLLAFVLLLSPMVAYGAAVTLAWDANTEPDLAGYNIYYGTASGNYSHSIDVGNVTQYTLTDLQDDVTYYLAATAYDEDENESAYSVELVHTTSNPIIDPTHTITTSVDAHGSISPSGSVTVSHGSNQTFTISADANYHVQDVLVDGVSVGAHTSHTFTDVAQDHTIQASFAINTHTITATAGANGSISPSGSVTVNHGSSTTFTISADATYLIHDVLVDGASVGTDSTYTITNVTRNYAIAASFTAGNQPPIANAGPDQTAKEGVVVNLNGNNSSDPGGNITAYSWNQISGPPVHLSNSGQIQAHFTSPNVDPAGETLVFQLVVTDNEGLQATGSCSVYVTREAITDSDGDGVPDDQDDFPNDPEEYLDTDGDGVGNNADTDDDNDGMPDTWEVTYGLDPLKYDAADDSDGDGDSNINEYDSETDPTYNEGNFAPDPPQLLNPGNDKIVGLTPLLETGEFYDSNINDVHSQTQWKIVRVHDEFCVFDVTTSSSLTTLKVPKLILEDDLDYRWQVKYIDNQGTASAWSETGYFKTEFLETDSDGNGVLDEQEVNSNMDLDKDGVRDRDQEDIKCVATETGGFKVGISIREAENADSIVSIQSETPGDTDLLLSAQDGPNFLAFGLIHFKLLVKEPGDEVMVTIYLSKAAYDDGIWYKYDPVNGEWFDYSEFIDFSVNRKTVHLTLKDGGFGDADGIENGVIIDPLALRTATDHNSGSDFFAEDIAKNLDPSGMCFISSAGSRPSDRQVLSFWSGIRSRELSMVFILMMLACIGIEISLKIIRHRKIGRRTSLMEGWRNP